MVPGGAIDLARTIGGNMPDNIPEPELAALEAALKGLAPMAVAFDRDQLFFRAGQASLKQSPWRTRGAIAGLALAVCILGTLLAVQPRTQTVERVVHVTV